MQKDAEGYVYFVSGFQTDESFGLIKVGYASDWKARIAVLQTSLPFNLDVIAIYSGTREDEKRVHALLKSSHERREWFRHDDDVEQFLYDLQDAQILIQMERGDDYRPTISECLDYEDAGLKMDQAFSGWALTAKLPVEPPTSR